MAGLQVLFIPVAFFILVILLTRRRHDGARQLPPGPPGHDHTGLLEDHRWNTFKAWNDQYGWDLLFSKRGP
jgi:hypothetical protein